MDLLDLRAPDDRWLLRAEAVHRQLRPQLPEDHLGKMARVYAGGGRVVLTATRTGASRDTVPTGSGSRSAARTPR